MTSAVPTVLLRSWAALCIPPTSPCQPRPIELCIALDCFNLHRLVGPQRVSYDSSSGDSNTIRAIVGTGVLPDCAKPLLALSVPLGKLTLLSSLLLNFIYCHHHPIPPLAMLLVHLWDLRNRQPHLRVSLRRRVVRVCGAGCPHPGPRCAGPERLGRLLRGVC